MHGKITGIEASGAFLPVFHGVGCQHDLQNRGIHRPKWPGAYAFISGITMGVGNRETGHVQNHLNILLRQDFGQQFSRKPIL